MIGVKRFNFYLLDGFRDVVLAAEYERLEQECERLREQVKILQSDANSWQSGYNRGRKDRVSLGRSERDAALKQVERLREALTKISAYAPCSGVKDPGFTKMYMGILARDALTALQAKP